MPNRFQIISTALLNSLVCIDRSVTRGTSQVFAVFVGNVFTFTIFVALCQAEVNYINVVLGRFSATYQEVVRLDVSVNDALFVHFLNSFKQLYSNKEDRFEVEGALARLEQILERRPE